VGHAVVAEIGQRVGLEHGERFAQECLARTLLEQGFHQHEGVTVAFDGALIEDREDRRAFVALDLAVRPRHVHEGQKIENPRRVATESESADAFDQFLVVQLQRVGDRPELLGGILQSCTELGTPLGMLLREVFAVVAHAVQSTA